MKLILQKDIIKLGKSGEVVEVKPGYGRNFLIPQGLAKIATEQEIANLETQKTELANRQEKKLSAAEKIKEKLDALELEFAKKVSAKDKIFGSVTEKEIAAKIASQFKIDLRENQIIIKKPIKQIGEHQIEIHLAKGIKSNIEVIVTGQKSKK